MGRTRLPARIRQLLPPEHREPQKRPKPETARSTLLAGTGCDSEIELILLNRLERAGLPVGQPQHRFVPGRQYRFDRAYPSEKVAIEVQGGIWTNGRHARGSGITAEAVKLSLAAALGWRVLPVTREMIESGEAVRLIAQALQVGVRDARRHD